MDSKRLFLSCVVLLASAGAGTALWGQAGGFAYVANCGSACFGGIDAGNVSAYSINGTTGALTPVAGSPFPAGLSPHSVTTHPIGRFAYVANYGSSNVSAYSIDGTTGALMPVPGSPFPTGTNPHSLTLDPTGRFAYVANANSNDVSAYTIDGATGALTPVAGSPFPAGSGPFSVTVDPTGQFAYVANHASNNVSAYTIDGTTGALTPVPGSPFPAGSDPFSVTVEPTGHFAYVADNQSDNVSAYSINATTGALTPVLGSPFLAGSGPFSVTVDPTGRFTYVTNNSSSSVSAYTIDGTTGALTAVPGSPFPAGSVPKSVTVDPTGQFAYVANQVSNSVSAYSINATTGALTPVVGSPFSTGINPYAVTTTAGPPTRQTVAFPGDQDTIHLYPFVCAADGSDAADTVQVNPVTLQNRGGVTYQQGSGDGFCDASSKSGASGLISSVNAPGNFGTIVFSVTFVDHGANFSFIDWTQDSTGGSNPYHVMIYRDFTNHMCIYMASAAEPPRGFCSTSTYSDGLEYHFAVTYDDGNNNVKLYDSANGLLFTRSFGHIPNPHPTSFAMGGINTDGNPGPSTLLSQVFIERRPWTAQEVQNYFDSFVRLPFIFPLKGTSPGVNDSLDADTVPITSIFDHSMKSHAGSYQIYGHCADSELNCDNVVTAYSVEEGRRTFGSGPGADADCYAQEGLEDFFINGFYVGSGSRSQYLCYDNHPGLDYKASLGTEVYAAVSGTVHYPRFMVGPGGDSYNTWHVLEIIPDSLSTFRIYYLHLSTHPSSAETVTKDDAQGCPNQRITLPLPEGSRVQAGCLVALSGYAGLGNPAAAHLHFEVQKVLSRSAVPPDIWPSVQCLDNGDPGVRGKACVPVDPYGWSGDLTQLDPYTTLTGIVSSRLW